MKFLSISLQKSCQIFLIKMLFINVIARIEAFGEKKISAANFCESTFWYNPNLAKGVGESLPFSALLRGLRILV